MKLPLKTPKLKYNSTTEEGEVVFPEDWNKIPSVIRADILSDWIVDLTTKYNDTIKSGFGS